MNHLRKFAKMYAAGGAVLIAQPFAEDIVNVLVWLASLFSLPVPETVRVSLARLVTALAAGAGAGIAKNQSEAP
jgi:hypothetical protein